MHMEALGGWAGRPPGAPPMQPFAMRILPSLAVWFLILLGAIANGGLREAVLLPRLGTTTAYLASGVLLAP